MDSFKWSNIGLTRVSVKGGNRKNVQRNDSLIFPKFEGKKKKPRALKLQLHSPALRAHSLIRETPV